MIKTKVCLFMFTYLWTTVRVIYNEQYFRMETSKIICFFVSFFPESDADFFLYTGIIPPFSPIFPMRRNINFIHIYGELNLRETNTILRIRKMFAELWKKNVFMNAPLLNNGRRMTTRCDKCKKYKRYKYSHYCSKPSIFFFT